MKAIGAALGALAAVFVLSIVGFYVAQPTSYRIARTRTIASPMDTVRAHLEDVHAFEAWQPWPPMPGQAPTVTYSPAARGVGAWIDRRDDEGSGVRTTITRVADDEIVMENVTSGSFGNGSSTQTFSLRASGEGTEVTWALSSELHGLGRLLWPFVGLEARIGPDMDAALGRLDAACH